MSGKNNIKPTLKYSALDLTLKSLSKKGRLRLNPLNYLIDEMVDAPELYTDILPLSIKATLRRKGSL